MPPLQQFANRRPILGFWRQSLEPRNKVGRKRNAGRNSRVQFSQGRIEPCTRPLS
jgi:hypothetical protein